jgi:hypothetical protein
MGELAEVGVLACDMTIGNQKSHEEPIKKLKREDFLDQHAETWD